MWRLLLGLGLFLSAGWSLLSAQRVLFPRRVPRAIPQDLPALTRYRVTAPDGASVDAWLMECPSPRARLILIHGYSADRFQVLELGHRLRERGFEVALCELRGHGERPGPCTLGVKETEDIGAILGWARGRDRDRPLPVGLLGFSMGGAVACQAAARYADVRAVVADSVYSHFYPILAAAIRERYHLPAMPCAWLTWVGLRVLLRRPPAALDPAALAPRLRQPLFAIQGGADQRVPPGPASAWYRRWAGPKERWEEPGVAHVGMFAKDPQAYCDRVAAFLDRFLR